jgi:hypothetical protein
MSSSGTGGGTGGTGPTTTGTGGGTGGSGMGGVGTGGSGTGGVGTGGSGTGGVGTGGTGKGGAGTGGTGANGSGGSAPTTGAGGTSGTAGSGGTSGAGGSGATGGAARTAELIGPSPATMNCGATNATHGDGFICALNYPSQPNFVGYWFDYAFSANTCTVSFTKPAGNSASDPEVCFTGSACAATSGGGLGLALCDVHGINVSTWPQLMGIESMGNVSTTGKNAVGGCNPGSTIASVNWTVSSGSIPAGTSVLFDNAADADVTRVDNLAAGATSAAVPAGVDASTVASIKFSVSGATSTSWHFCLSSLKVTIQ